MYVMFVLWPSMTEAVTFKTIKETHTRNNQLHDFTLSLFSSWQQKPEIKKHEILESPCAYILKNRENVN